MRTALAIFVATAACSADRAQVQNDPAPEHAPVSVSAPELAPAPAPTPAPAPAPAAIAASITLDIPARDQAPERPAEGWCAETALQEALLYYGTLVDQADINAAGKPRTPDLYWSNVPIAMRALDLRYTKWPGGKDLDEFLGWVRASIRAGHPVIAGVKLYPTSFPQWGLDHIVLIVGFETDQALVINTTWGTRQVRTIAELTQTEEGISLSNRYGEFFAYSIEGVDA